jgi:hypothetical protein
MIGERTSLMSNGLVVIRTIVLEISKLVQENPNTNLILVEMLVRTINTSLFRIMVGVVATIHIPLQRILILESLTINVT